MTGDSSQVNALTHSIYSKVWVDQGSAEYGTQTAPVDGGRYGTNTSRFHSHNKLAGIPGQMQHRRVIIRNHIIMTDEFIEKIHPSRCLHRSSGETKSLTAI